MVLLENNKGYKWTSIEGVHFKGYFTIDGDVSLRVYRDKTACEILRKMSSFNDFIRFIKTMEGCWSVIVERTDTTWIAVDIARSMPLFFTSDGGLISDSAEKIRSTLGIARESVDKDNLVELYANYYLFGHKTVYSQVSQLDLGEAAEIKLTGVNISKYFQHINAIDNSTEEQLIRKIGVASDNTFKRIKAVIGDRPVVLSMSGGYDSRFVGCMLKNAGIKDVSCYTYGKPTSFEVIQSKKNADALGFRWICVEMTDELVSRNLDEVGKAYINSYNCHDFTAYMQNFTAVRKLNEEGWFKKDSVFLTGLCGDMPTGEYVLNFEPNKRYSKETAVGALYDLIFSRYELESGHKEKWYDEIGLQLDSIPFEIKDYHSWHQAIDCIYTGSCHSHWYMHMNSVHSFFGYEWLIPYWDKELLMAWYSVPSEYKVKQKMYEDWLMDVVCKPFGLSQRKKVVVYSDNKFKKKIQYVLGGVLNYLLLHLGIPFKRAQDYNNFAPFELELFQQIKSRDCINYRRAGMMQLLEYYLLERRYGEDNLRYACKHTKSKQ